ncbi:hypothetical protein TRVL_03240 [Trypanosoma vivax]|nr:hypothetical protein TRVL_03240 [Trypanosoma vivax]
MMCGHSPVCGYKDRHAAMHATRQTVQSRTAYRTLVRHVSGWTGGSKARDASPSCGLFINTNAAVGAICFHKMLDTSLSICGTSVAEMPLDMRITKPAFLLEKASKREVTNSALVAVPLLAPPSML